MKITRDEVEHVAELARLRFEGAELERFVAQLRSIIGYVEKLSELDTTGVPPTYHVLDLPTPMREDDVEPLLGQDEALGNAPVREGDYFTVPKFIED